MDHSWTKATSNLAYVYYAVRMWTLSNLYTMVFSKSLSLQCFYVQMIPHSHTNFHPSDFLMSPDPWTWTNKIRKNGDLHLDKQTYSWVFTHAYLNTFRPNIVIFPFWSKLSLLHTQPRSKEEQRLQSMRHSRISLNSAGINLIQVWIIPCQYNRNPKYQHPCSSQPFEKPKRQYKNIEGIMA